MLTMTLQTILQDAEHSHATPERRSLAVSAPARFALLSFKLSCFSSVRRDTRHGHVGLTSMPLDVQEEGWSCHPQLLQATSQLPAAASSITATGRIMTQMDAFCPTQPHDQACVDWPTSDWAMTSLSPPETTRPGCVDSQSSMSTADIPSLKLYCL